MRMRRIASLLLAVILMFAGLGAFAEEQTKITVLTRWSGSDPMAEYLDTFIKEFEAANPDVKVENISVNEEASYNNKFKTLVATGDIPNIFYLPGIASLVKYAQNGLIMDVSELFSDKEWHDGFVDGAFDMFNFEPYGVKGVYAIPFAVTPEVLFYNVDLLKSIGYDTFPETMDDFYAMMDKLVAKGIAPFAPGAKETWRTGHFHNQFLYRWCGVPKAMDLGARKAKWTDEDVVKSLAYVKDMNDRGYFEENCVGLTYDMEKQMFFSQQSAMVNNGSWFIGDITSAGTLPFKVGVAKFPYFKEKPEFKDHIICYPQNFVLKGGMGEKEKDATIRFIKAYTGKENQTRVIVEKGTLPIRKDIDYTGIQVSDLFKQCMDIVSSSTAQGGDSFDYDQLSSMQDVTRNAIVGMLLGNSPEQAAQEIQTEIDANG